MKSKAITRIVLTVLLIGTLTLAFNFQLDKARANPALNEAELPVYKVGEYWYYKYQNLTDPRSPWNLTQRVIGEGVFSGIDCYVMNLTFKPNTPRNNTGMFNDMKGWFPKSQPDVPVKEEAHGYTSGYGWVWNQSFAYQILEGPDFWPIMVGNALELNTTTTEDVWLTTYLGTPITPYHSSHMEWFNVTWVKVEAIENVTVLGVTYEDCFRVVTYDKTNTTVISREWYSPEAEYWVKSENYVTKEYYDLISFHKFIVVPYVSSSVALNYTSSYNKGTPQFRPYSVSSTGNCTFSPPDANGVVNMTIPEQTMSSQSWYDPISNVTNVVTPAADSYGKLYTRNNTGYVDIISMTNDTGMFFWKSGTWHPAGNQWIGGDGKPGPAGSAWITGTYTVSVYWGNGTGGPLLGRYSRQYWITTGFSQNTVNQTGSRLNGFRVNATGVPYSNVTAGGIVTYVLTQAGLNIPFYMGYLDVQTKEVITFSPLPSIIFSLFHSPNLYVTDPMNRHIGTDPATGKLVNEIPGAFCSGPGSEPQRVIIPNPLNGVYDIKLIGTKTENYSLVVELATINKTSAQTYTGNITAGQTLATKATVSAGVIASTPPTPTPTVGGIYIPVNKLGLLAPYIALASTIIIATAATGIYVKRRKKKQ
jgi:hypothetical protein